MIMKTKKILENPKFQEFQESPRRADQRYNERDDSSTPALLAAPPRK